VRGVLGNFCIAQSRAAVSVFEVHVGPFMKEKLHDGRISVLDGDVQSGAAFVRGVLRVRILTLRENEVNDPARA
jgi:hypothetical protein